MPTATIRHVLPLLVASRALIGAAESHRLRHHGSTVASEHHHHHHHHYHHHPEDNDGGHHPRLHHDCAYDRLFQDFKQHQRPMMVPQTYSDDGGRGGAEDSTAATDAHHRQHGRQLQARQSLRIATVWGTSAAGAHPCRQSGSQDRDCYCGAGGPVVNWDGLSESTCSGEDTLSTAKRGLLESAVADAAAWIGAALRVTRVQGSLKLTTGWNGASSSFCGFSSAGTYGIQASSSSVTSGVPNADFVLFVSAVPTQGNTLAWAYGCMRDQHGRPIAGHVNFGPSHVDTGTMTRGATLASSSRDYRQLVSTAVHEVFHALGFSNSNFGNSQWFGGADPSVQVTERGHAVTKMNSPAVLAKAREYFGCPTLDGLELENQGGSGTAGSHWEKRVLGNEAMTGVSGAHEEEWSAMTLAFFEDTGFYDVDYAAASADFQWGKGKGCSFATAKCNEIVPAAEEFCFPADPGEEQAGCDYHLRARGFCQVYRWSSSLDSQYRYFEDPAYGGQQPSWGGLADYCPVFSGYSNDSCVETAGMNTGSDAILGNARGASSRCFADSDIVKSGWSSSAKNTRCFPVTCSSDCRSYTIQVSDGGGGFTTLTCGESGGTHTVPGFQGSVTCWPAATMCSGRGQAGSCASAPAAVPCEGAWGACDSSCQKTFAVTTPAAHGGTACSHSNNATAPCQPSDSSTDACTDEGGPGGDNDDDDNDSDDGNSSSDPSTTDGSSGEDDGGGGGPGGIVAAVSGAVALMAIAAALLVIRYRCHGSKDSQHKRSGKNRRGSTYEEGDANAIMHAMEMGKRTKKSGGAEQGAAVVTTSKAPRPPAPRAAKKTKPPLPAKAGPHKAPRLPAPRRPKGKSLLARARNTATPPPKPAPRRKLPPTDTTAEARSGRSRRGPRSFAAGDVVRVLGGGSNAGVLGSVVRWVPEKRRFLVKLGGNRGARRFLPEKLALVRPSPAGCA